MSQHNYHQSEEIRARQRVPAGHHHWETQEGAQASIQSVALHSYHLRVPFGMQHAPNIAGRGNSPVRAASMQQMQQTHGNHAIQRSIQRATAQKAVPVQRWGLDDIWDTFRRGSSVVGDAMQNNIPSTPDRAPVGPVVSGDNFFPVGPVVEGDNIAVPESPHSGDYPQDWPAYEPYV